MTKEKHHPRTVAQALLAWYDRFGRVLPWRARAPEKPNPYHVWVSEIMLQQTTVATTIPYFERFITTWPTLEDLACASIEEVLVLWQGLGYYRRAHALHACAQQVFQRFHGQFPLDERDLLSLPGIGPYTAGAIQAIVFEKPVLTIDGNISRVMSRLFALTLEEKERHKAIEKQGTPLMPPARIGDYTQALMDLGAMICTPKAPKCPQCPLQDHCLAWAKGTPMLYPPPKKPKRIPSRFAHFFWIQNQKGDVFFRQEQEKKLLHGLMTLPSTPWHENDIPPVFPLEGEWTEIPAPPPHVFTHFKLYVRLWKHVTSTPHPGQKGEWIHPDLFEKKAFSKLIMKMITATKACE